MTTEEGKTRKSLVVVHCRPYGRGTSHTNLLTLIHTQCHRRIEKIERESSRFSTNRGACFFVVEILPNSHVFKQSAAAILLRVCVCASISFIVNAKHLTNQPETCWMRICHLISFDCDASLMLFARFRMQYFPNNLRCAIAIYPPLRAQPNQPGKRI